MTPIHVALVDGRTIKVLICQESFDWEAIPLPWVPVNTTHCEPVTYLCRGENVYGELSDYIYVSGNAPEASHFVLSMGDDGSQWDDDRGRLFPVAWLELSSIGDFDDLFDDRHAAAIMLYAWFQWARQNWGEDYYEDCEVTGHGMLQSDYVEDLIVAAHAGDPLKLPST